MRGKKEQEDPQLWGTNLIGEILGAALSKADTNLDVIEYTRQILQIEPWVTQRAIMKSFFGGDLDPEEIEVLERWFTEGKTNWRPGRKYKNLTVEAGMRSSKCVEEDTVIPTSDGIVRPTEILPETEDEDVETELIGTKVMTRHGLRDVASGVSQSVKKGHRIATERGYVLGGSTDHPVMVVDDYFRQVLSRTKGSLPAVYKSDWTTLSDLEVRQWVIMQRGNLAWGTDDKKIEWEDHERHHRTNWACVVPEKMSPELGEFMGMVMAKAVNFSRPNIYFVVKGVKEFDDRLRELCCDIFHYHIPERGASSSFYKKVLGFYNQRAFDFLTHLGLGNCAMEDLRIPWAVRSHSRETLRQFLKAFILNRCTWTGAEHTDDSLVMWHSSVKLIKELMSLLLLFGVKCQYRMGSSASNRGAAHYLRFEGDDYKDLQKYIVDGEIFQTQDGEYHELFADRVVRKYDIEKPMYDLCVPDGLEFIGNGFAVHNTAIASFIVTYLFYKLINLENPGLHYGQLPGQPLYITVVATSEEQSKDTIFGYCCTRLEQSPYFRNLINEGRLLVGATRIAFPEKRIVIRAGHSNQKGLVGTTAPAFVMDEANRFDSEMGINGMEMYENVGKATKTFAPFDDIGFRMVISSAWLVGDVTDTLINMCNTDTENRTKTLYFKLTTYEVNPTVTQEDFADTYFLEPERAYRDYENIRPGSTQRILNEDMLKLAQEAWKEKIGRQAAVFDNYEFSENEQLYVGKRILNVDKVGAGQIVSYAALDVAVSGDSYALAVGHGIPDPDGQGVLAVIDLVTYWKPKLTRAGHHLVNFNNVEDIFLELAKARGVVEVHSDRWNSEGSLQLFNRHGILPMRSSETNKVQYNNYMAFKVALNQKKILLPDDPLVLKEGKHIMLIHGKKIDHPEHFDDKQKGSKDLMDVITKVVARILKDDGILYSYHEMKLDTTRPPAQRYHRENVAQQQLQQFLNPGQQQPGRGTIGNRYNNFR